MYKLLELYARPLRRDEPVICLDEKSTQLLGDSRPPLPMRPGVPARQDYEYVRGGTCNLFVAVEPKGGRRTVTVTERRAKVDFVAFVRELLEDVYGSARRVHLVLDNLNIHFRRCFEEVLGMKAAAKLLQRVQFHYTPKHASWLNMAEIEIGSLPASVWTSRWAMDNLIGLVAAWQREQQHRHQWTFTRQDADWKLGRHYVT
jgi:hypothetical protein